MKISGRLYYLSVFFLAYCRVSWSQIDSIKFLEERTGYYLRLVDSLQDKINARQYLDLQPQCRLPGHYTYYLNEHGIAFPANALKISKKSRILYARVYALHDLATSYYTNKVYLAATEIWKKALRLTEINNYSFEELHMFRPALNNNYFLSGDYPQAMVISTAGLAQAEIINDIERSGHFSNVIGYIHMKQENFTEAFQYYNSYLRISRQMESQINEAHALYNLGDLFVASGEFDKAISFLNQSLKLYMRVDDTSRFKLFSRDERNAFVSNKLAVAYKLKGNYRKALEILNGAVRNILWLTHSINEYDKASYFINTGDIYNRLNAPDSAIPFLKQGLDISRAIKHREHVRDAFEQLAVSYGKKKIYDSAFFNFREFINLKDSLVSETSQREIFQLEASLQVEKQYAATIRQRNLRNIILGVSGFLLIILFLLYNRYRLRQKNRYQAELNKQQLEILRTTINVQDNERKRIAQDLHDGLGSILSAAKLKLSALSENGFREANEKEKLLDSLVLLDEALQEMKNIAYDIMPATLSRLGLTAALQNLFNRLSTRSGLNINYSTHGFTDRLNESIELSIYRIILEAVNNVVKHANASQLTVQLVKYPDYINIMIEDDGIGFNTKGHTQFAGNGLNNIDSRVKNLKGTVHIDSRKGSGTTIIAEIPVN